VPDFSLAQKLEFEQRILGMTVSEHPLAPYEAQLRRWRPVPANRLERYAGKRVTVAGWLVTLRRAVTKNQEYMEFVTLEDRTDTIEVVLFPDTYQRFGHLFRTLGPYIIVGTVESHHGAAALTVERVEALH
jgi:DNA polymerase III alpha subunit